MAYFRVLSCRDPPSTVTESAVREIGISQPCKPALSFHGQEGPVKPQKLVNHSAERNG